MKLTTLLVEILNEASIDQQGVVKSDKYDKLKIGEVDGFTVYKIPKGATRLKTTSCELGSGTGWCTAQSKSPDFRKYVQKGPLYIFDNGKGEKYQFHYESGEFMDKNNKFIA